MRAFGPVLFLVLLLPAMHIAHSSAANTQPSNPTATPTAIWTSPPPRRPTTMMDHGAATGAAERFEQTTYWACVTWDGYRHCGWHTPMMGAGAAPRYRGGGGARAVGAAVVAVVFLVWIA